MPDEQFSIRWSERARAAAPGFKWKPPKLPKKPMERAEKTSVSTILLAVTWPVWLVLFFIAFGLYQICVLIAITVMVIFGGRDD